MQGEIYLADLDLAHGHEQSGFRPVLVMQNNILNETLSTAIVAPLTSNLRAKGKLTTYFLPKRTSELDKDSVVLLFQLRTLDKTRLKKRIAKLPPSEFVAIKEQLRFVF